MTQSLELGSVELPREAREALARCDDARLAELLDLSEHLTEGSNTAKHLRRFDRAEVEAFAKVIEITKENMTILRRSWVVAPTRLEYQPFFTRTEGAMN